MPSNYERQWGNRGYGRWGRGQRVEELPGVSWLTFDSFAGGYDKRDSRQDVARNASPYFLDMQVTEDDKIARAPGLEQIEAFVGRNPGQMAMQAGIDYNSELIFFDAPFFGRKPSASNTLWVDAALPVGRYAWVNFGDTLIFSPGHTGAYSHVIGAAGITTMVEAPPAKAYGNFAARVFAGNVVKGGSNEPLGVMWSAASALPDDWTGAGSGYELLIGSSNQADKVIAFRPLGFDQMAILCRRSLWLATRTPVTDRPANFQLRAEGSGALSEACCSVVPGGVLYLSDGGVFLFDGSQAQLVSASINEDLLPLDLANLDQYSTYYHPGTKFFYLFTPSGTWILDTARERWYRRSAILRGAAAFGFGSPAAENYDLYVLGANSAGGTSLGREFQDSYTNFGFQLTPTWEFPLTHGEGMNRLVTHSQLLLEYTGKATIEIQHPDLEGVYKTVKVSGLADAADERVIPLSYRATSLGLGLRIKMVSGVAEFSKVQVGYIPRGARREQAVLAWLQLDAETGDYIHTTQGSRDAEWVYDAIKGQYVLTVGAPATSDAARIVLIGDTFTQQ